MPCVYFCSPGRVEKFRFSFRTFCCNVLPLLLRRDVVNFLKNPFAILLKIKQRCLSNEFWNRIDQFLMDGSEELLRVQIQAGFAVDGITMFNFPIAISEYPFAIRMKRHTFRFAQKTESVVSGR